VPRVAEKRRIRTDGYGSLPDSRRHSVRLSGVTVPAELLERVRAAAGDERGALSAAVREALEAWVTPAARAR
jgi:post-segregation antitoxin (ccd killing protein)